MRSFCAILSAFFALVVFKDNVINVNIKPRTQIFPYFLHQFIFPLLQQSGAECFLNLIKGLSSARRFFLYVQSITSYY